MSPKAIHEGESHEGKSAPISEIVVYGDVNVRKFGTTIIFENDKLLKKNSLLSQLQGLLGFIRIETDEHGQVFVQRGMTSVPVESAPLDPKVPLSVKVFR